MLTCEVDIQLRVNHRKRTVMDELGQRTVRSKTVSQRKFRMKSGGDSVVTKDIMTRIEGEDMDKTLTNITEVGAQPDSEVEMIMKYLSHLQHELTL